MSTRKEQFKNINEYIAHFPPEVQKILHNLRSGIRKLAPEAQETISYGIPTFDLNKKHLVHFAAFKNHIGFFPTSSGIQAFQKEISQYKHSKGTVQFPLDKPIPYKLVEKITKYRVKYVEEKPKTYEN